MKKFTVDENTNLRDFTDSVYPQGSFCLAQLLRNRDVKVNGTRVNKNVALSAGDEVIYYTTPKQEAMKSHEVVYEDENIYVADKYSGVSSEALFSELSERGGFYAVHRLDRNTQGLIIFSKTLVLKQVFLNVFKEREVQKTYIALCKNCFKTCKSVLVSCIKKDEKNALVKVYDRQIEGGMKIITEYKVLEDRGDIALVEIKLHTGRTHQIRAHMAHIGCPVLGDEKYGDSVLNAKYGVKRQCLVSKSLKFNLKGEYEYLNNLNLVSSFNL